MSRDQARYNPNFNSVHQVNYLQWCFLHAAPPPVFESFEKAEEIIGETRTQLLRLPKIRKHLETTNEWKFALYFRLKNFVYPNEFSSRGRAGENCLETHAEFEQNRSNPLSEEQLAPPPSQPAVTDTNPLQFSTDDKQAYFYGSPEPADNPVVHASCMGNRLSNEDASIDGVLNNADARWFTHEDIKEVLINTYAALNEEMKTSDAQQSYLTINIQNAFALEEEVQTQSEGNTATPEWKPMDGSVDEETNGDGQKMTPSPSAGIARIDKAPIRSLTQTAGSTLCTSWQIPRADGSVDVYTANVGDSRAIAFRREGNEWEGIVLSQDHTVQYCLEKGDYERSEDLKIINYGNDHYRVTATLKQTSQLSVGRAMGDFEIKDLPRHPDIQHFLVKPDQEVYILTGCDGFWLWADHHREDLFKILNEHQDRQNYNALSQQLVITAAGDARVSDNVSVTLAPVRTRTINHGEEAMPSQTTMVVSGIADGHGGTAVSSFLEEKFLPELQKQIKIKLLKIYLDFLKGVKKEQQLFMDAGRNVANKDDLNVPMDSFGILDNAEITLPIEAKNTSINPGALNQWIQKEIALVDRDIANSESTIEAMNQNGNIENESGGAGDSKREGGSERQEEATNNGLTAQQRNKNMQKATQFVRRIKPVVDNAVTLFGEPKKRFGNNNDQKTKNKRDTMQKHLTAHLQDKSLSTARNFITVRNALNNPKVIEVFETHRNIAKIVIPIIVLTLLGILPGLIYLAITSHYRRLMPKSARNRIEILEGVKAVTRPTPMTRMRQNS